MENKDCKTTSFGSIAKSVKAIKMTRFCTMNCPAMNCLFDGNMFRHFVFNFFLCFLVYVEAGRCVNDSTCLTNTLSCNAIRSSLASSMFATFMSIE